MKVFTTIAKIVAAIAAVAGIAYLVIKYLDAIKAWLNKLCPCADFELEDDFISDDEIPAEDDAAEEAPAEAPAEDDAAEAPADEADPVAEETDFEA